MQELRRDFIIYFNLKIKVWDSKYNELIEYFIKVLEQNFSHCDLSSFYKNLETLKTVEKNNNILEKLEKKLNYRVAGYYNAKKNKIRMFINENDTDYEEHWNHELLHMATSKKGFRSLFSGFHKRINGVEVGRGLNEGYTELLNVRFFSYNKSKYDPSYKFLQMYARGIENIVDEKKMQQLYFTNDLEGVIKILENYTTRDKAINLILKIDRVYRIAARMGDAVEYARINKEIHADIANITLNKLEKSRQEGKITEREYKNSLFAQELFMNDYTSHPITYEDKIYGYTISKGPTEYNVATILSEEEYEKLVDNYYEIKKEKLSFTSESWVNAEGKTIKNILEEKIQNTELKSQESRYKKPRMIANEESSWNFNLSRKPENNDINEMFSPKSQQIESNKNSK